MEDNHSNREIGEANKLARLKNYCIWSLKIRTLLRIEGLQELTKAFFSPTSFPADYARMNIIAVKLKKLKVLAIKILIMSVNDDLINIVAEQTKPTTAWAALKKAYNQVRSQSQILTFTGQFQNLKLVEGASMEDIASQTNYYILKAWEIKNRLKSMDETVIDKVANYQSLDQLHMDASSQEICALGGKIHAVQGLKSVSIKTPTELRFN